MRNYIGTKKLEVAFKQRKTPQHASFWEAFALLVGVEEDLVSFTLSFLCL